MNLNLKSVIIIFFLLLTALVRGYNMFHYPAYQEDEGTYLAQSWAITREGKLDPYTYWYDHAPGGWILLAVWHAAAGYLNFGLSVNTGRIFILILTVASAWLVFRLTHKITGNFLAAILALTIFAVTPLGIDTQRRVLLDNIMLFWLLLAFNLLVNRNLKLTSVLGSAAAFGLAVLTKESAVFFLPLLAVGAYFYSRPTNRRFAISLWLSIVFLLISLYPLLAFYKEELFPTGTLLGGDHPHVSLWEALRFQIERGGGGAFWNPASDFRQSLQTAWLVNDPFLLVFGLLAVIANLFSFRRFGFGLLAGGALLYLGYLIRGGVVLDWYIIPLIPFFAINIGLLFSQIQKLLAIHRWDTPLTLALFAGLFLVPLFYQFYLARFLFVADHTVNQRMAVEWLKTNIPSSAVIVIDNYPFVDLREKSGSTRTFPNAHYYWKVEQDPAIRLGILQDDWENADYFLFTEAIEKTIQEEDLPFIRTILDNSQPVVTFGYQRSAERPYVVEIREVQSERKYLRFGWEWYQKNFITPDGRVVDLSQGNRTTSEGQSYALLRAVWMDDRSTFDRVWRWTRDNLQGSENSSLFSWLAHDSQSQIAIADHASAADADVDIALALLFAAKRWQDAAYYQTALPILTDIWEKETATVDNFRVLLAGNWVADDAVYTLNPSYFAPYAYRIFAEVQPDRDWQSLVDGSFEFLDRCAAGAALPADWCFIDHAGRLSADQADTGLSDRLYSYDAQRLPWRLALDYKWNNIQDRRSLDALLRLPVFRDQWRAQRQIFATYTTAGTPRERTEALSAYASLLGYFQLTDNAAAAEVYTEKIKDAMRFNHEGVYWGDPNQYYDQNWVWFGLALQENFLENLWHFEFANDQARLN